ncbi:MAG: CdaR family protein [Anaerolineae bacterium]
MESFRKQLTDNLSSMILALLLAVAVWIAASLQSDPFAVWEFANVPVDLVDQPENTVLFEGEAGNVNIKVRAPQSVLESLNLSEFDVQVDLSEVEMGASSTVPISVTVNNDWVRIQSYSPEEIVVRLEPVETVTLPVEIMVLGEVATGYQATQPDVRPEVAVIRGPLPYLGEVVSVIGSLNIAGAREDVSQRVNITPRDADGRLVPTVDWDPDQVEVTIGVRRRVGFKPDVQVVPDLRGDPAPGYRRGSVSVDPSTVTLQGPTAVLADLPGFVTTFPISITGATEDITVRRPLTVPNSVVIVEGNYVLVSVEILPVMSSRTLTRTVEIEGLGQGWQAILSPPLVQVIVEGPEALLDDLSPEALQVFVNLSGYTLGVHRVVPSYFAPEGVRVVNVIPETIEVIIGLPPTRPPPTATLTIEGAP